MEVSYRNLRGLNQSLLKKILISPSSFQREKERKTDSEEDHFVFGSMVDDLLLNPKSFEDKYYVMEEGSLSDSFKNITRYVKDYVVSTGRTISFTEKELEPILYHGIDSPFSGNLKPFNKLKATIKEKINRIPGRKFNGT